MHLFCLENSAKKFIVSEYVCRRRAIQNTFCVSSCVLKKKSVEGSLGIKIFSVKYNLWKTQSEYTKRKLPFSADLHVACYLFDCLERLKNKSWFWVSINIQQLLDFSNFFLTVYYLLPFSDFMVNLS